MPNPVLYAGSLVVWVVSAGALFPTVVLVKRSVPVRVWVATTVGLVFDCELLGWNETWNAACGPLCALTPEFTVPIFHVTVREVSS